MLNVSNHARCRMANRALRVEFVELAEEYGKQISLGNGVESLYVPKRVLIRIESELKRELSAKRREVAKIKRRLKSCKRGYVVQRPRGVSTPGVIITVAHQTRRLPRS